MKELKRVYYEDPSEVEGIVGNESLPVILQHVTDNYVAFGVPDYHTYDEETGAMEYSQDLYDDENLKEALRKDTVIETLLAATPSQINTWVENNVNSLDDAKTLFKLLLKLMKLSLRD